MIRGFVVSMMLHLAVLAWALFSFALTPALDLPDVQPISVSIITPSEMTRIKEGDPDAKELEAKAKDEPKPDPAKKEAPKPKPVTAPPPPAEPPPPPPEEAKAEPPPKPEPPKPEPKADPIADKIAALPPPKPEPAPGPTPEELKQAEEQKRLEEQRKAEEQKKAEEKKRQDEERRKKTEELRKKNLKEKQEREKKLAEQRKREQEKKKQFDADRIAALIDKSPDKRGGPTSAATPTKPTTHTGPTAGEHGGKDTVLSAREQDMLAGMLKAQIAPCWRLPGSGGGTENPVVTLRWRMRQDGSLEGEPQVARPAAGPMAGLATEAAMRAVKGCAPFKLPAEHYSAWKEVIWEFDPSKML